MAPCRLLVCHVKPPFCLCGHWPREQVLDIAPRLIYGPASSCADCIWHRQVESAYGFSHTSAPPIGRWSNVAGTDISDAEPSTARAKVSWIPRNFPSCNLGSTGAARHETIQTLVFVIAIPAAPANGSRVARVTVLAWALCTAVYTSIGLPALADEPCACSSPNGWQYGASLDVSYPLNFNFPENHLWRNRSTVPRHNELSPNMGMAYVGRKASPDSEWGIELAVQGGYDSREFAFLPGEPKLSGADTLRHVGLANVSYWAPKGDGLTLTAGLFSSFLGSEKLYAKDNVHYTRAWTSDYSPYAMFGVTAVYRMNKSVTLSGFVVNGYAHLSRPNDHPSYGLGLTFTPLPCVTFSHTLYAGPDQQRTDLEFWRYYLSNVMTWEDRQFSVTLTYDVGTENIADRPGAPRAFVMGGSVSIRWQFAPKKWYAAIRPEFYWDRNGRWTGSEQFVKAMTTTLDYAPFSDCEPRIFRNTHVRLEYRWDDSTGANGGFFRRGDSTPGVPGLTGSQHLIILGLLWTFDQRLS